MTEQPLTQRHVLDILTAAKLITPSGAGTYLANGEDVTTEVLDLSLALASRAAFKVKPLKWSGPVPSAPGAPMADVWPCEDWNFWIVRKKGTETYTLCQNFTPEWTPASPYLGTFGFLEEAKAYAQAQHDREIAALIDGADITMPHWVIRKDKTHHPDTAGWYAVRVTEDCEIEDGRTVSSYDDYTTFAWFEPAQESAIEMFTGGWKGGFSLLQGEEDEEVFAWCGPVTVPDFALTGSVEPMGAPMNTMAPFTKQTAQAKRVTYYEVYVFYPSKKEAGDADISDTSGITLSKGTSRENVEKMISLMGGLGKDGHLTTEVLIVKDGWNQIWLNHTHTLADVMDAAQGTIKEKRQAP